MPTNKSLLTPIVLLTTALCFPVLTSAATTVAFLGDQGTGSDARDVLSLVAEEGTDLLMIQGDLGYADNSAAQWEANLTDALGKDFPVLTIVGNHENYEWPTYRSYIQQRINRAGELSCTGDTGVKATCQFRNIDIVQVAPGINEVAGVKSQDNYDGYIRTSFSDAESRWRICSWHKNQNAMQTGSKGDSTGWGVYDACLDAGAMIAMAHEHAYSRTYLLSDFANQTVAHYGSDMTLEPGKSFAFVSGLGGREVRPQKRGGDWFASIYTATQGATHGALFCHFEATTADCYFKAIDGAVPDRFVLRLPDANPEPVVVASAPPPPQVSAEQSGFVFSRTDKEEFRWIEQDDAGRWGNIRIDAECAQRLGGATRSGDWKALITLSPEFDAAPLPCSANTTAASTTESETVQADIPATGEGFVFSRTDKDEYRWIAPGTSGQMASVRIDKQCADRMGGPKSQGRWSILMQLAPDFDGISSPCSTAGAVSPDTASSNSVTFNIGEGYVFSRTDKDEFRWIDRDASGQWGNIRISRNCADQLGGATVSGRWSTLMRVSPGFDAISSPCS
ncbi:MAG: hypothetical protein HKN42_13470 [Granulosicoccus sp.]|nr:hypothetical protein [Granulosicoccus sp.]